MKILKQQKRNTWGLFLLRGQLFKGPLANFDKSNLSFLGNSWSHCDENKLENGKIIFGFQQNNENAGTIFDFCKVRKEFTFWLCDGRNPFLKRASLHDAFKINLFKYSHNPHKTSWFLWGQINHHVSEWCPVYESDKQSGSTALVKNMELTANHWNVFLLLNSLHKILNVQIQAGRSYQLSGASTLLTAKCVPLNPTLAVSETTWFL